MGPDCTETVMSFQALFTAPLIYPFGNVRLNSGMDVYDYRRRALKAWADEVGGPAELARAIGRSDSQVSQLLGSKQMGSKLARELETIRGVPSGSFDLPNEPLDDDDMPSDRRKSTYVSRVKGAALKAGTGEVLWDFDEIDKSHSFRLDWMQRKGLRADRCKVWTVRGDSMEPRYYSGDIVLIDMADRTPVHGKVYALVGEDGLRIKQLRRTPTGWEMYSYNPDKDTYPTEPIVDDNFAIIGRVRWRAGEED